MFFSIFPNTDPINVQLARLVVLYEDLKIEVTCASTNEAVPAAEALGEDYRHLYFLRRAFATLEEFDTAFHQLNMDRDFKRALKGWSTAHRNEWARMIKFFAHNRQFLKDVRNAIGGHFSDAAAKFALDEVYKDSVAQLEIIAHPTATGAGVKFHLAGDLVANALLKEKGTKKDSDYVRELFEFGLKGYEEATHAMHLIAANYLVPRFQ